MSNIAMQGGATGTGTVTLLAPVTNTNRTLTLPDATGTVATAESTLTQFNASGSAPVYACRAWVNFNGTGTPAIRGSGNVSSITDNGTGDYTVNFTTAMSDVNYSAVATPQGYHAALNDTTPLATNSAKIITFYVSSTSGARTLYDVAFVDVAIFR